MPASGEVANSVASRGLLAGTFWYSSSCGERAGRAFWPGEARWSWSSGESSWQARLEAREYARSSTREVLSNRALRAPTSQASCRSGEDRLVCDSRGLRWEGRTIAIRSSPRHTVCTLHHRKEQTVGATPTTFANSGRLHSPHCERVPTLGIGERQVLRARANSSQYPLPTGRDRVLRG